MTGSIQRIQLPFSTMTTIGIFLVDPSLTFLYRFNFLGHTVDSVTNLASKSYEVAQNYSQDDVAFAQLPTSDGEDTTVDYAPLLEEENV